MNHDYEEMRAQYKRLVIDTIESLADGGMPYVRAVYRAIETSVNDPMLAESVIRKVARAVDDDQDRIEQLALLLSVVMIKRDHPNEEERLKTPAGYFGSSAKRMLRGWSVPWEEPPAARVRGNR